MQCLVYLFGNQPLLLWRLQIPENVQDIAAFLEETRVVLDGGASHIAHVRADGKFVFHDLGEASYTLQVYTPNYMFDTLRVYVSSRFENDVRIQKANPEHLVGGRCCCLLVF
jgi:hypothetical protein